MLKEEAIERKRITGVNTFNKRTSLIDDNEIPGKKLKVNNENTEDKIYELPSVCIFFILLINYIMEVIKKFNYYVF